jgi:serine/threonine-protein kinase HipA
MVPTLRTWRQHFDACVVSAKDIEYIAPAFLPECFFFEKPPETWLTTAICKRARSAQ